MHLSLVPNFFF